MMGKKTIYLFWYLHFFLFLIFTVMMSDAIGSRKEAGNLNISISWPSAISPQQQTLLSGIIRIGSMPFFLWGYTARCSRTQGLPSSHLLQAPRNLSSLPLLRLASFQLQPWPLWILCWFLTMFRRFLQEQKQEPNQCPLLSQRMPLALHTRVLFTFSQLTLLVVRFHSKKESSTAEKKVWNPLPGQIA